MATSGVLFDVDGTLVDTPYLHAVTWWEAIRQGGFDVPGTLQAGIAVDVSPHVTVMLDYRRIWFSGVASVGNPSSIVFADLAPS